MKLGIKLIYTSEGVKSGPEFNSDETLRRYASDVRSYVRKVFPDRNQLKAKGLNENSSFDESGKIIYMLQFLGEEGYLLTLIKARPELTGRAGDNTAAWIHVPKAMDISGEEFEKVIKDIEEVLNDKLYIDENKLKKISEREYQENDALTPHLISKGENIGVYFYGTGADYQLKEILGKSIRQKEFSERPAVFFVDKGTGIEILDKKSIIDIRIKPVVKVNCPEKRDGFTPYLGNKPFNRPIEICEGEKLPIIWKREGFKDIEKRVEVSGKGVDINRYCPKPNEELMIFRREWFKVCSDDSKEPLKEASVYINGTRFTGDTLPVPLDSVKNGYTLKVEYPGYNKVTESIKEISINPKTKPIHLKKSMRHYEYTIPAYDDNGEPIKEEVKATLDTNAVITGSPIEGYKLAESKNGSKKLKYTNGTYLSMFISFCVGAALTALIFGIVYFFSNYRIVFGWPPIQEKTTEIVDPANEGTPAGTDVTLNDSIRISAIQYLDSNENWDKGAMEDITYLTGLFDDLNNFNFKSLKENWAPKLQDSKKFQSILQEVNNIPESHFNLYTGGTYNVPNDPVITVPNYIKKLKRDSDKIKGNNPNQASAQTGNNQSNTSAKNEIKDNKANEDKIISKEEKPKFKEDKPKFKEDKTNSKEEKPKSKEDKPKSKEEKSDPKA